MPIGRLAPRFCFWSPHRVMNVLIGRLIPCLLLSERACVRVCVCVCVCVCQVGFSEVPCLVEQAPMTISVRPMIACLVLSCAKQQRRNSHDRLACP